jgi:hypothetical protein
MWEQPKLLENIHSETQATGKDGEVVYRSHTHSLGKEEMACKLFRTNSLKKKAM